MATILLRFSKIFNKFDIGIGINYTVGQHINQSPDGNIKIQKSYPHNIKITLNMSK